MANEKNILEGEVISEVRHDSVLNALKSYRWYIVGVVFTIIAIVAGQQIYGAKQSAYRTAQTDRVMNVLMDQSVDGSITDDNSSALTYMLEAKRAESAGDIERAKVLYQEAIAHANTGVDSALAKLNLFALDETMDPSELIAEGAPFSVEAKLIIVQRHLAAGRKEEGLALAKELENDPRAASILSLLELLIIKNGGELGSGELASNLEQGAVEENALGEQVDENVSVDTSTSVAEKPSGEGEE